MQKNYFKTIFLCSLFAICVKCFPVPAVHYSVVIPLKDEAANIEALIEEIEPVMNHLQQPWELICIENGSTDSTRQILFRLAKLKPYLHLILFDKNYGQTGALDAGFKYAKGKWIITLDGDRQNDPADIPKLLQYSESYDLICGKRECRKDSWIKNMTSKLANTVRQWMCDDDVTDTGCGLKAFRRPCLAKIKLFQGMHRFLPALFKMEGFSIKEVPISHRERKEGVSKYNFFNRSFNTVADLFVVMWMKDRHLDYHIQNLDELVTAGLE